MPTKSATDILIRRIDAINQELQTNADDYRYGHEKYNLSWILLCMSGRHLSRGMHAYYVAHNSEQFKQEFYVATRLDLRRYSLHHEQELGIGSVLNYALLSDCQSVIDEAAFLEVPQHIERRDDPRTSNFLLHMYQLAVRDEHPALRQKIAVGAARSGKAHRIEFSEGTDFFSLLLARDKTGLETRIEKLARIPAKAVEFEGLMAVAATMEAKICWLKGIEVKIDSPMLPMALMPHQPLVKYENVYDFLEPGWVAPKQGLSRKLLSWFGRRAKNN